MKAISLKIDDPLFVETEKILSITKKPRNRYVNEAIAYYNKVQKRKIVEQKLAMEYRLMKAELSALQKEPGHLK
jgi:hypothetical protein